MGKFSRDKGRRGELALKKYLIEKGFDALRVPLSGASEGYKGDVVATKDGRTYTFELKCRKSEFSKIYTLVDEIYTGLMDNNRSNLMLVSLDLQEVLNYHGQVFVWHPEHTKTIDKLIKYKQWLGNADILVLKDDRKRFIFIKYL